VITVSGKGSGRVSIVGLVCYRPGKRSHLFYRVLVHRGRKGERRSFSEAGYAALLTAAHQQLRAPLIVCWDNLNTHISAAMREFIAAHHDWLTVVRLSAYAPDLNPAGRRGPLQAKFSTKELRELAAIDNIDLVDVQLAIRSVGYRGVGLPGVPFDVERGVIPHLDGRVSRAEGRSVGEYVVGWIVMPSMTLSVMVEMVCRDTSAP
jgi:hypothetical protein